MHEYFAISVHFVVFYTVFNQKPWHFATFSRKIIRLSDNLGKVMITQRFHHFITRQNYLLWTDCCILRIDTRKNFLVKKEPKITLYPWLLPYYILVVITY